ncbi:Neuron navigator 2 [Bagarius yarrelli]|uniref:Neuron navigator 2 n=1 Tax=Bagarius yarrelli TaxID=175774 RepID=A0A556U323_BAGYA|nr:Neuron navigator 2 [Bagarius yarrelli]
MALVDVYIPERNNSRTFCDYYKTIYTDWANHYLAKSGCKQLIKDLQQDVSDGVLLAEIIQVVANEKIEDINDRPKSHSQMQQQQQSTLHTPLTHTHTHTAQAHTASSHGTHASAGQIQRSQAEMQSRLPGPTSRVSAVCVEGLSPRGSVGSAGNRRSQTFSEKIKPAASHTRDSSDSIASQTSIMTEHASSSSATTSNISSTVLPSPSITSSAASCSAIPQPNSSSKPWRSKSLSTKNTSTSTFSPVKAEAPSKLAPPTDPPPKSLPQKSMLEKLKLFNSKSGSKSSTPPESAVQMTLMLEKVEGSENAGEGNGYALTSSSPKMALKGIAQRTFSRATKKGSVKGVDKDKDGDKEKERVKEKDKDKEKGKETSKRMFTFDKAASRDPTTEDLSTRNEVNTAAAEPKRTSKIASLIPKGGKTGSKKENTTSMHSSGIPKPGSKGTAKSSGVPLSGKDNERPRSMRLSGGIGFHGDSRPSSSSSSLASTEGKGHPNHSITSASNGGTTQSTASNTVSVQLPQPQQQYSHPNTATVAPFMYSALDTFDSGVPTEMNPRGFRSSRGSALSWTNRIGLSSPRLQAGDAPSPGNGYPAHGGIGGSALGHTRYLYSAPLRRQIAARNSAVCGLELGEHDRDELEVDVSGYVSDGDVLAKNAHPDELSSGWTCADAGNFAKTCGDRSRRCRQKRSTVERHSSWSCDEVRKSDGGSDSGVKLESSVKWRQNPSDVSDESDKGGSGRRAGVVSQTGSWRRGMSAQAGVTTVNSGAGMVKTHRIAKTDDAKVSEKGRISPHANTIQSCDSASSRVSLSYKKPGLGSVSASVATTTSSITASRIISGSATLGKIPKSTALLVGGVRSDAKGLTAEDGGLSSSNRSTLQYRSLPRPSRSSHKRSSISSIESGSSNRGSALSLTVPSNKTRESISNAVTNQTDKEKSGVSDTDNLRANVGAKQVAASDPLKNSLVISNPHATLGHHTLSSVGSLDSPSAGSSVGAGGSEQVSSPGSGYSGGTGTWGHPSVSSMNTSTDSIDMSVSSGNQRDSSHHPITRNGSSKTDRYTPSPQLRPEDARDWLRSYSISGLQDSTSNSPFSTGSSLTSPSGTRFNFAQLTSPTAAAQLNMRSNQETALETCTEGRLRNSCVSLDEKSRVMSRSASFRDGFEEVHGSSLSLVSSTSSIYSTLRSSFKQAFTKKKSPKSASSHSDIEEMNDSLPSSPKLPHNGSSSSTPMTRNSNSRLPEGLDGEAETVMQLRSELREKEMKLTDIRLEALSSAHQLDQLREAMNRMQTEIEKLKAENDQLKMENQTPNGGRSIIMPSSVAAPSADLAQQNHHESSSFGILLDDSGGDGAFRKDGQHVRIVVSLQPEDTPWKEDSRPRDFLIGCIGVSGKTKWDVLDGVVKRLFKEYIRHVDPVSQLGLSSDSVEAYRIGDVIRPGRAKTPELLPCGYLVGENKTINISINGPSGTGKTYLAQRLAEHLTLLEGRTDTNTAIATFSVDHKSSKLVLATYVYVCIVCPYIIGTMSQTTSSSPNLQLHHNFRWVLCANHTEPVKGFLGRFLRRKLIETEISSRTRNPELVKIVEWIPCLWHHLNCFLEAHSSSDVTIGQKDFGPRLFLSCPMDVDGSRVWFTDLWNYSIVPYMLEAVREGLQLYGRRAAWDDPARWVIDTFPWRATSKHHDWPALLKLRPEDVGLDGGSTFKEGATKQNTQSDSDADPLMNMLMRLKEAANCSSAQSYDSDSNSNGHHDDILDTSLESTL